MKTLAVVVASLPSRLALLGLLSVAGIGCEVPVGEGAPVAVISGDAVGYAGEAVVFDGSKSYVPGRPDASLEYEWTLLDPTRREGEAAPEGSASGASFSVTAARGGRYTVRLVVRAGAAESTPAYANLQTFEGNLPPVAGVVGDEEVGEQRAELALDGRSSFDPEGGALTFSWQQVDGPRVALVDTAKAVAHFTTDRVLSPQTLTFELTVSDPEGLKDTVTVTRTVLNDINEPPQITIGGDQTVLPGATVTLQSTPSDPNPGDTLRVTWQVISGPQVSLTPVAPYGVRFTAPTTPSTLILSAVAYDGKDNSAPARSTVVVDTDSPDLAKSKITVSPTTLPADGAQTALARVELVDLAGNPLPGRSVSFTTDLGQMIGSVQATGSGVYEQNFRAGTQAGVATLGFKVGGLTAPGTAKVTLTPGAPSGTFALSASPALIYVDAPGVSATRATLSSGVIKDSAGNMVKDGTLVTVSTNLGNIQATDWSGAAGVQVKTLAGKISFEVVSGTVAGVAKIDAVAGGASGTLELPIRPGPTTRLAISGISAQVGLAQPLSPKVQALDAVGNVTPGYRGTIRWTTSDPLGTVPADYGFSATDAGSRVFPDGVSFLTVGNARLLVQDLNTASIAGELRVEVVSPGNVTAIAFASPPRDVVAGECSAAHVVEARDGTTPVPVTSPLAINMVSSTPATTFFSDPACTQAVSSVTIPRANTQVSFYTKTTLAGPHSLVVEATALPPDAQGLNISAAAAANFVLTALPPAVRAGDATGVRIRVEDAFGNKTPTYTKRVTFSAPSDSAATLPAPYTFTLGDQGVHTFTGAVTFKRGGAQGLVVTEQGGGITSQVGYNVLPSNAHSSISATPTSGLRADGIESSTIAVVLKDALGNAMPGQSITFSATVGAVTAPADKGAGRYEAKLTSTTIGAATVAFKVGGLSYTPTATVTFIDPNRAPTAVASANTTGALPGDTILLDGSASTDPDGDTLSFSWSATRDGVAIGGFGPWASGATGSTSDKPTFYVDRPGTYIFTVQVSDGKLGDSATAQVVVASFAPLPYGNGQAREALSIALRASDGYLFMGTVNEGQAFVPSANGATGQIWELGCLVSANAQVVEVSGNGRVWYGFSDNRRFQRIEGLTSTSCTTTTIDPSSVLNNASRTYDIAFDGEDLLVCTDDNIVDYRPAGGGLIGEVRFDDFGASARYVAGVKDRRGRLWFGTREWAPDDGVVDSPNPHDPAASRIDLITGTSDRVSDLVLGVKSGALDELWITTTGNGLIRVTNVSNISNRRRYHSGASDFPHADFDLVYTGALEGTTGDLWFATRRGLLRYKRDVSALILFPETAAGGAYGLDCGGDCVDVAVERHASRGQSVYVATGSGVSRAHASN